MRRAVLLLGPLGLLAASIFACENDGRGLGGPTLSLDGSAPSFDAATQPIDATVPDAPEGPPSVTVAMTTHDGAPKADVRVVFHDATGAVLETKLTGADGKATSTGSLPAMASALLTAGLDRHIVTWTGLENGDVLALRDTETSNDTIIGKYDVTLIGDVNNASAIGYDLVAGYCASNIQGTATLTGSIDLWRSCIRGAQSSVLVRARDEGNQAIAHSFKKGNAVPTDGGAVAVATGPWKPSATFSLTATNLPVGVGETYSEILEIADGQGYQSSSYLQNGTASFTIADGFADALQASIWVYGGGLGAAQMMTKHFAPTGSVAFDASQTLPPITSAETTGSDPRRPVLTWSSTSTAGADGGLVRVRFYRPQEASSAWTFVVPPGSTTVTAPAMPPEAEDWLPSTEAGAEAFEVPEVVFVEADVLPSYSDFRKQQGVLIGPEVSLGGFRLPALPTNGTYRSTSWMLTR